MAHGAQKLPITAPFRERLVAVGVKGEGQSYRATVGLGSGLESSIFQPFVEAIRRNEDLGGLRLSRWQHQAQSSQLSWDFRLFSLASFLPKGFVCFYWDVTSQNDVQANYYRSRKQHFGILFLPEMLKNVPCSFNELLVNFREESSEIGRFCRLEVPTDGQLTQFR